MTKTNDLAPASKAQILGIQWWARLIYWYQLVYMYIYHVSNSPFLLFANLRIDNS